jgi:hypothetical protein
MVLLVQQVVQVQMAQLVLSVLQVAQAQMEPLEVQAQMERPANKVLQVT